MVSASVRFPYLDYGINSLTVLQPEIIPTIEIDEECMRTPTMNHINIADACDLQHRANTAERELAIEHTKLERERRKTRRLQSQISEYIEALARSTRDCSHVMNQCQMVSNTNMALSKELGKAKLMVETLEAVILLLYTSRSGKDGCTGKSQSNGEVSAS